MFIAYVRVQLIVPLGVGREQAPRSSGSGFAKSLPEPRRRGSLLPAYTSSNFDSVFKPSLGFCFKQSLFKCRLILFGLGPFDFFDLVWRGDLPNAKWRERFARSRPEINLFLSGRIGCRHTQNNKTDDNGSHSFTPYND